MTTYIEVILAWPNPVIYSDQVTTTDLSGGRRLQESVQLIGDLLTFSMSTDLDLPDIELLSFSENQVVLKLTNPSGKAYEYSDLEG